MKCSMDMKIHFYTLNGLEKVIENILNITINKESQ